ncbi:LysR substrate-binding domain-containing protein [Agrobacterium tumefaciens]|uniref:LysR substrate-binding domain-containing protein n=1 Tax=Agrobacterium tumefaciens TaxID=358 RepID=UPI001FAA5DE0|nr:LysR substrate-binding domain-containing protein [Agrobacterium tumefaciens]UNZ52261.1 hypothetical protein MLE07_15740 [Agrobacterium tumefaciens]
MLKQSVSARHGWLFTDPQKAVVTNSLQLVKQLARSGRYIAFTSELDAAPELSEGSLIFLLVRDKGAEPQTVSVAIGASKPLSRIGRIVADLLTVEIKASLDSARLQHVQS